MTPADMLSVSLAGTGATFSRPETAAELIPAIKEYYDQLKAPYLSAQRHIRQHLHAEGERLQDCRTEMLFCGRDRQRMVRLKQREKAHELEINEMQAGLSWALAKIRDLEKEMEEKIHTAGLSYPADTCGSSNTLLASIHEA